jgi:transcriptional regulator with XRE-family HTH domain
MNDVGKEVRRLREERGLTGAQLAARAGMAPSAISQIETGKRIPLSTSIVKIAEALELEVSELYPKKAQAPLPLFDPAEGQRHGAERSFVEAMAALQAACRGYERLGAELVKQGRAALEAWDEKLPPGEKEAGSADLVEGLFEWTWQLGQSMTAYKVVAEVFFPRGSELEDIVRRMEEVYAATLEKLYRIGDKVKTDVAFREIVERMEKVDLDVR